MKTSFVNTYNEKYIALLPSIYLGWERKVLYFEFLFWSLYIFF